MAGVFAMIWIKKRERLGILMAHYAVVMLLAGVGIPVLAALNAGLGSRIGSPAAAATVLFVIAFSVSLLVAMVVGRVVCTGLCVARRRRICAARGDSLQCVWV